MKHYQNYGQYVRDFLRANEIKLKTVYVEDGNYNPHFVYLNRIANCSNPKFRILERGKDKVKNCIMVTFNPDRHDRDYIAYLLKSKLRVITRHSVGSCHSFIRQSEVGEALAGVYDERGRYRRELLEQPVI